MKIGKTKPGSRVFLAPLAGFSTLPFRILCKEYGAGLVYTEMASVKAILHGNTKTMDLLSTQKKEKPVFLQLFGKEEAEFAEATELVGSRFDGIDINAGCPVPKVLKQGGGSALMKHPKKIGSIVEAVASKTNKPITVKTRLGINNNDISVLKVMEECEDAGAEAICIHARTAKQGFGGKADRSWIRKAAEKSRGIKVIGNGDIRSGADAKSMLEETGCDFAMIGRGAMGNAFVFRQCKEALKGKKESEGSLAEKKKEFARFCALEKKHQVPALEFKAMAMHYLKGEKFASRARNKIAHAGEKESVKKTVLESLV